MIGRGRGGGRIGQGSMMIVWACAACPKANETAAAIARRIRRVVIVVSSLADRRLRHIAVLPGQVRLSFVLDSDRAVQFQE